MRGKVFKGIISLNKYCEECNVIFDEDKIGDGASWISTSLLCLLSLPLALLFNFYLENPDMLGKIAKSKIDKNGLHRTVCDYVAGCTDRFAMLECKKYGLTNE